MKFRVLWRAAMCAAALVASSAAIASPVLLGTTTNPTGIDGLVVDGTTYNVTFSITTLNSFTQGTVQSIDAAIALSAALNSLGVVELGDQGNQATGYFIGVDNTLSPLDIAQCNTAGGSTCVAPWFYNITGGVPLGEQNLGFNNIYLEAADFSAVPEPLTLSLFGAGLVGAVAMRRRKQPSTHGQKRLRGVRS